MSSFSMKVKNEIINLNTTKTEKIALLSSYIRNNAVITTDSILINEFSDKRNLISNDELIDYFALSQSLPGIIAANISMFIGYKLNGIIGALVAMFGIITILFLCIKLCSVICIYCYAKFTRPLIDTQIIA